MKRLLTIALVLGGILFAGCATVPTLDQRDPAIWQPSNPQYPTP